MNKSNNFINASYNHTLRTVLLFRIFGVAIKFISPEHISMIKYQVKACTNFISTLQIAYTYSYILRIYFKIILQILLVRPFTMMNYFMNV